MRIEIASLTNWKEEVKEVEIANNNKPAFRWVILACLAMYPFLALAPQVAPAVLLPDIMKDMNIGISSAGLIIMIGTVMCGVCMFVGAYIESALGSRKALILGIWLLALGNGVIALAPQFAVLILGRILCGTGGGICISCGNTLIYQWFEGKEQAYVITLINLVNPAAGALGATVAIPLSAAVGGWQKMYFVFAAVGVAVAIFWTIFIKPRPEVVAAIAAMKAQQAENPSAVKQKSPIVRALAYKQFWVLMVCGILVNMATSAVSSYLPTWVTTEVGLSGETAASISSTLQVAGAIGTIVSGYIIAQIGRRKPFWLLGVGAFSVCFFGLTFMTSGLVIGILAGLAQGAYYFVPNSQSLMVMETPNPPDPTMISASFALCYGVGQIFSIFNSSIFGALSGSVGMTMALRVFAVIPLVAFVIGFLLLRETGAHAKQK